MSEDYNQYLAVNVLNEQQLINYRNLSRALKVHSNVAKQMLYDFHRRQNSKKPASVHATYVLTGTKLSNSTADALHSQNNEDTVMNSSPPLPSSSFQQQDHDDAPEVVPIRSVMVVREEHLEKARAQFEKITGIHIYSLQATGLSDFQLLTDCNRRVASEYASEDPLKEWKQYGVIQNPHVKRRARKDGPPPPRPAAAPTRKPEPTKAKSAPAPPKPAREDSQDSKVSTKSTTTEPVKTGATRTAAAPAKREGGIFKAFTKGAAKPKKETPAPVEDVPMTGFSDDDDDEHVDSGVLEDAAETKEPAGPSRKDRKAELEAMMEQEDEPMEDVPKPAVEEEDEETEKIDNGALDAPPAREEPKETVTVENGRRRGRRRVMKKKTVKDEEGYLVTREEAVWEEFSEEEPAPKKARISAPAPTTSKSSEKKTAKKGQGNIMSFFGKR